MRVHVYTCVYHVCACVHMCVSGVCMCTHVCVCVKEGERKTEREREKSWDRDERQTD